MRKIGRIYTLFVIGMLVSVSLSAAFSADSPEEEPGEITICETSSGDPRTITISEAELDTHLAAGDTIGPCEEDEIEKLDHFKCYSASGRLYFNETVKLKDQFGEAHAGVLYAYEFCNPVEKIHEDKVTPIKDPNAHLTLYLIQRPSVPDRTVIVNNQFGEDQLIKVSQPFALLVPTQKYPHPEPIGLDHYQCYEASGETADAKVHLSDQFIDTDDVPVLEPSMFCLPVEKTHKDKVTPIENPKAHLVCYNIKEGPIMKVSPIRNQFSYYDYLTISDVRVLCVPSEKDEPEVEKKLDHFRCYYTFAWGKPVNEGVYLRDQFGESGARVIRPYLFCNPTEKTHNGVVTPITNPDAHLKMYFIKTYGKGPYRLDAPRDVVVSNQFGEDQELSILSKRFLAAPTQKYPHQPPEGLDHFKCYNVRGRPLYYQMVGLKDQFLNEPFVRMYLPFMLCNPVVKTHAGKVTPVEHPEDHLVCYRTQARPYYNYVFTNNQFGYELLLIRHAFILCVPSKKWTPPTTDPNIQQLCGDYDAVNFDGGMVLPGGPGTGLYKDNPNVMWPAGRPRRPCGNFVPIDGFLPPAGVSRFRVAYRPAGALIPAPGDAATTTIKTKWILRDRNPGPFCAVNPAHILETDADGWMDASDYLEAKSGGPSTDFCTNSGLRLAVWDTMGLDGIGGDSNGHYVVWLEWDNGAFQREPFEHHIQLDNILPVINDFKVTLKDGTTPVGPCGEAPGEEIFRVYADFEDDYYWRYRLRVRGGSPPASAYFGWHNYYDGTSYVANTDTTGTTPDGVTVFLREINLTAALGASFTDCCYVLDLWVGDSSIRHSFNHRFANHQGYGSPWLANEFITFEASPP